ncbi:MAG: hypothetical protein CSB01_00670 [Bacteroidia bacterium]|nr:MAG: hypothetical protein CSB01_00670 [Bacteroidia bacterium]
MKVFITTFLFLFTTSFLFSQESARLYNSGIEKMKAKQYKEANDIFLKAIAEAQKEGKTAKGSWYYQVATSALRSKQFDKAIAYYDSAIVRNYKKPGKCQLYKATAYQKKNDTENYLQTLKEGFEKYPKNPEFGMKLGLSHYSTAATHQSEASKLTKSNPAKCKEELLNAKKAFESAKPYLEKTKEILAAKVEKAKKPKQKAKNQKKLEKTKQALDATTKALPEIDQAIKALDEANK